jgi:hypothetical protein
MQMSKTEPTITMPEPFTLPVETYISEEKMEETLKETMGDIAFKQYVSDQQYGKVG